MPRPVEPPPPSPSTRPTPVPAEFAPESEDERRLPVGYYADNFELVLTTAAERYSDLLRSEERDFHQSYDELSTAGRRLYVRLISRRGPLFRRDRLSYPEIPSIREAIRELIEAGLADRAEESSAEELLWLLLRPELASLARELAAQVASGARKHELIEALLERVDEPELEQAVRSRLEVLRPLGLDHVLTFRLLFFGNLTQGWTEFVLRDLGVVRFEPYELKRDLRLFPTRAALDHSLILRQYRHLTRLFLHAGEVDTARDLALEVLDQADGWHPSTHRLVDQILNRVGRDLERAEDLERALALYEAAAAPPARERRARVLEKLGRLDEALALCREIAADARDETEVSFAPRFAHRLRRRLGESLAPLPRRQRPVQELVLEPQEGTAIETLVLTAYADSGRAGFHSENWLWRSLFGLAFWDVIFAPVAGAFQHPFQSGPLDLRSPGFRRARQEAVARRLAELEADPQPGPRLLELWELKQGTANRLVAWGEGVRPLLELALSRLHGRHLAVVCDRLSRDLGRYRCGFPDLFVVREEDPGFELYEVKGPGDQLRPEQRAWIDYLNDQGIPTSVLKVRWSR